MDFSNLFSNYSRSFGSPNVPVGNVVQDPSGTTWGPAVTRLTKTPINFTTGKAMDNPTDLGEYYPQGDKAKTITVNPLLDDPHETIRHESIHALMDQLPLKQQANIATSAPNFLSIANVVGRQAAGIPEIEVPAYMGSSPTSKFLGVSDDDRNAFVNHIQQTLMNLNPSMGNTFQRLLQSGQK